jgi:nucleoside-diphosphate-sugar epimerase
MSGGILIRDMAIDTASLAQELLQPSAALVADVASLQGDLILLGAGGKMGPSMASLARRAMDAAGNPGQVIAVSRFSDAAARAAMEKENIRTIAADLLDEDQLAALPDAANVIYLAGTKFGTTGNEPLTWAMNSYLPGRVASRYRHSRLVVLSTGNVYPLSPVAHGGMTESDAPSPVGEYGQSCLGRERIFQYFSRQHGTPVLIYRLNYAIDFRYGVLLEVARAVAEERPVDLTTGHVNVIWQGDANEIAIRALHHASSPAEILNVTGPETVSVRWLAEQFAALLDKEPRFIGEARETALLSNASLAHRRFGYPRVTLRQMIEITVAWLQTGGEVLNKPTHFQERQGKF